MSETRKRLREGSTIATILIVVISLAAGAFGASMLCRISEGSTALAQQEAENTPEPTPETVTTSATMFMVGDALLHATIPYDAQQADGSYDFTRELHRVGAIAQNYDLRYWNQETVLAGDEYGIHSYPCFNGPRAWGEAMVNYGFNLVSLANNHPLDMGEDGCVASTAYWKSKKNVVSSGTYLSKADREAITVHEINGIKYAFFSWTYGMNGFQNPDDAPYLVACYDGHTDEMLNQIKEAKKVADVVIVAMHWGTEYVMEANDEQQILAQQLANAGADIIVGNHPHVIGPVQWLNQGKTICFYAMGNLCAAQYSESKIEMMGALTIEKTTTDGVSTIALKNVKADLMYQYNRDDWTNCEIVPFYQMTDDSYCPNHTAVYEEYKQVINSMGANIQIGGF